MNVELTYGFRDPGPALALYSRHPTMTVSGAVRGLVLLASMTTAFSRVTPSSAVDAQASRVTASLERYARGDFEAVDALVGGRPVRSLVREFRGQAGEWIDRAPPADRQQRTAVASAMAIELLATTFDQHFADYESARELVEWACPRLRRFPPTDFERWFHLTSIALLQGARDDSLLSGFQRNLAVVAMPTSGSHAEHAGLRFPREGRFKLAFVTANWETQQIATWPLTPSYLIRLSYGRFAIEQGNEIQALDASHKMLAALFDDPGVGAEARLRNGILRVLRGHMAAARVDLQHALSAQDASVRSLAQLLLGHLADQAGESREALRLFRQAYDTVPAATSAVALAGRLYRSGFLDEGTAVLEIFESGPPPPDPWELYGQRDFRFFGAYREQMRRSLVR